MVKFYPLMFMLCNLLELHLKELACYGKHCEIPSNKFKESQSTHNILKIWNISKPVVLRYELSDEELIFIEKVEHGIDNINKIDNRGDIFRYPTNKNLQYEFNNKTVDVENTYNYMMAIINSIDAIKSQLDHNMDILFSN